MRIFSNLLEKLQWYVFRIQSIPKADLINWILSKLHWIALLWGCFLIFLGVRGTRKRRIQLRRRRRLFSAKGISSLLRKNKMITFFINYISDTLGFFNTYSIEVNDVIALFIYIVYLVVVYFIIQYTNQFAFLWYTKVLNIGIAFFLPFVLINTFKGIMLNQLTKEVPDAFLEIMSAYNSMMRIRKAIPEAIKYMPTNIRREFIRFNRYIQSEITYNDGLEYFKKRMRNRYITIFCGILKASHLKNSDISKQLEYLAMETRGKNYLSEKATRQLVWFRVFTILWLLSIPAIMNFISRISKEAYGYYFTVEGGIIFTAAIASCVFSYCVIYIMEKS